VTSSPPFRIRRLRDAYNAAHSVIAGLDPGNPSSS
jgi:hypothetical protein